MKMKAADKEKWLDALRSGEYAQCPEVLSDGKGYCCLGVLQVVLSGDVERCAPNSPLGVPTKEWLDEHGIEVETRKCNVRQSVNYGKDYYQTASTKSINKHYYNVDQTGTFSQLLFMNDDMKQVFDDVNGKLIETSDHRYTFKDIADYIDKHVETH